MNGPKPPTRDLRGHRDPGSGWGTPQDTLGMVSRAWGPPLGIIPAESPVSMKKFWCQMWDKQEPLIFWIHDGNIFLWKNKNFSQTGPWPWLILDRGDLPSGDGWWSPNSDGVFGSMEGAGGLWGRGTAWSYPFSIYPRTWAVLFPSFSFPFFLKGF